MDNLFFKKKLLLIAIFLFFLLPIFFITLYHYQVASNYFNQTMGPNHESVSFLAASLIGEKFNVLKELVTTYGLSRDLRSQVIQNNWGGAINIAREILKVHPDVERISIFDPKGTYMSGFPVATELTGQNFAYRDWYKGAIKTDNTYLSDIAKRKADPTYNVINMGTPIKDFDNNLIGVLTLQVRLSRITNWAKDFEFGKGTVYFVDRKGQVSGDPKFSELDKTIPNFSNLSVVKKVLQGKQGVEVQNGQLVAYSPVKEYGWGVIAQEPIKETFKARDAYLLKTIIFGSILMMNHLILCWLLLRKF